MAEDMQSDEQGMDAKMDPTALVREDVISDRRVGTIRMLTPITVEGVRAANQIVTPGMPGFQAPPAPGGSGIVMP